MPATAEAGAFIGRKFGDAASEADLTRAFHFLAGPGKRLPQKVPRRARYTRFR